MLGIPTPRNCNNHYHFNFVVYTRFINSIVRRKQRTFVSAKLNFVLKLLNRRWWNKILINVFLINNCKFSGKFELISKKTSRKTRKNIRIILEKILRYFYVHFIQSFRIMCKKFFKIFAKVVEKSCNICSKHDLL